MLPIKNFEDLIGTKHGCLQIVNVAFKIDHIIYFNVKCDCGRTDQKNLNHPIYRNRIPTFCSQVCPKHPRQRVMYDGIEYTKEKLAKKFGLDRRTLARRLQKKIPLDAPIPTKRDGSLQRLAKSLGIGYHALHRRIQKYGANSPLVMIPKKEFAHLVAKQRQAKLRGPHETQSG